MELKTRVKVNRITNLHDARYCAGMGVEMIGFPIEDADEQEKGPINEIIGWLAGVNFIAEVESEHYLEEFNVQQIQVNSHTLLDFYARNSQLPIIYKIRFNGDSIEEELEELKSSVFFFLVELADSISIDSVWEELKLLCSAYPVFIGSQVTKENVLKIVEEIQPEGVAIDPGKELKVGLNDFDELADILELLEVED